MTRITDADIEELAEEIFLDLRAYDNPRDAESVLALVQWKLIEATFEPKDRAAAIESVDATAALIKKFIEERLQ